METQLENLKTLREGIACLAAGDQGFAASLIFQYDAKGGLTEKQWYWIERLGAGAIRRHHTDTIIFVGRDP